MADPLTSLRGLDSVVSRPQALAHGLSRARVARLVRSGRWQRLHPGVYYQHSGPIPWRSRARAGLLYSGVGGLLAGATAGYLWGLTPREPAIIDVMIPAARRVVRQPGIRVTRRTGTMSSKVRRGFPVTTASRTALDILASALTSIDDVWSLIGSGCSAGVLTPDALATELKQTARHRWRAEIVAAIGADVAGISSALEMRTQHHVLARHGITGFKVQAPVVDEAGVVLARRDFENEALGIVIEVDGQAWHLGDRFATDRARDRRTAAEGKVTLRFTWVDVNDRACQAARDVVLTMRTRGWRGVAPRCRPACCVPALGTGMSSSMVEERVR